MAASSWARLPVTRARSVAVWAGSPASRLPSQNLVAQLCVLDQIGEPEPAVRQLPGLVDALVEVFQSGLRVVPAKIRPARFSADG